MGPDERFDVTSAQADVDPDLVAPARPRSSVRGARPSILAMVAVGGILGTLSRYGVSRILHVAPDSFPWATFTVNITGSFALGLLLTLAAERWPPSRYVRPFFAIGYLGAYTTFSTFMVETDLLVKDGALRVAALYLLGTLMCGFAAVSLGVVAGRLRPRGRKDGG